MSAAGTISSASFMFFHRSCLDYPANGIICEFLKDEALIYNDNTCWKVYSHPARIREAKSHFHFYLCGSCLYVLDNDGQVCERKHGMIAVRQAVDAIQKYRGMRIDIAHQLEQSVVGPDSPEVPNSYASFELPTKVDMISAENGLSKAR